MITNLISKSESSKWLIQFVKQKKRSNGISGYEKRVNYRVLYLANYKSDIEEKWIDRFKKKKWHTDKNWTTKSTCFEQPTTGLKLSEK